MDKPTDKFRDKPRDNSMDKPIDNSMGKHKFRVDPKDCIYVIIDVQERLVPAMDETDRVATLKGTPSVTQMCLKLGIPVIAMRQYPKGLGDIVPIIKDDLCSAEIVDKVTFSACGQEKFNDLLLQYKDRKTVIISGMETHVCVLMTTIDLLDAGYNVHVLGDCCASRINERKMAGLDYMRQAGAVITDSEIIIMQLIGGSTHEHFKAASGLIK